MKLRKAAAGIAAAALLTAGCSLFRWSGNHDAEHSRNWVWSTGDLAGPETRVSVPAEVSADKLPDTLYYADLGAEDIDVAAYPERQRKNYDLFAKECSRCHTLARAINSPTESRAYWRFHLARMNLHMRFRRMSGLSDAQTNDVLDFLDYDADVRKVRDAKRFEETTAGLKRRFEPILRTLLERMRGEARPVPPPAP